MSNCSYHHNNYLNLHHLEGNVFSHTKESYYIATNLNYSIYIKWAIILHDLGRIYTRRISEENDRVSFGNFEGVSIYVGLEILYQTSLTDQEKIRILKIVAFQYTIIDYIKFQDPSFDDLLKKFNYDTELLEDLAYYVKCDLMGRKIDNSKSHLYNLSLIDDLLLKIKKISFINVDIKTKKNNIAYILVGPPCSRKSSWIKNNINGNSIIINRDTCVEAIGKNYNKFCYDECYDLMSNNKHIKYEVDTLDNKLENIAKNSSNIDIIIDNPNLKIKNRSEWIIALKETHLIKVILFLTPFNNLIECSKTRSLQIQKTISTDTLIRKLKTFEFPLKSEGFDEIEFIFNK